MVFLKGVHAIDDTLAYFSPSLFGSILFKTRVRPEEDNLTNRIARSVFIPPRNWLPLVRIYEVLGQFERKQNTHPFLIEISLLSGKAKIAGKNYPSNLSFIILADSPSVSPIGSSLKVLALSPKRADITPPEV